MSITALTARRPPTPADDPDLDPPTAPAAADPAPPPAPDDKPTPPRRRRPTLMQALGAVGAIGSMTVGAIGFAMSYETLESTAHDDWGFSPTAASWFPIGVDGAIIAFLALDLYMVRRGAPWPLLRTIAHALTLVTVVLNANAYGSIKEDPVQALAHGLMPVLFVVGVEAGRRLIINAERMEAGTATDSIPVVRWLLAPLRTPRLYREMRLTGVRSYDEMVRRQRDLRGYRIWLDRRYAGTDKEPTLEELLPLQLAPLGYTVDQALAVPGEQDAAEIARQADAAARAHQAHLDRIAAEAETAAREAEATEMREVAQIEADRRIAAARRAAEDEASAAAREAAHLAQLEETAAMKEAAARAAEADRLAAEHRAAQRAADAVGARVAELDQHAEVAVAKRKAADASREAADATREEERARRAAADATREADEAALAADRVARDRAEAARMIALAEHTTAVANREAADANRAAADARRAAADAEAAAADAEAIARLTPTQRAVRWSMREIESRASRETGQRPTPEQAVGHVGLLPYADIETRWAVSASAAGGYRTRAKALFVAGISGHGDVAAFTAAWASTDTDA